MIWEILSLSRQQKMLKLRDWILGKYALEKSPSTTEQLFVDYSFDSWIKTPVVSTESSNRYATIQKRPVEEPLI